MHSIYLTTCILNLKFGNILTMPMLQIDENYIQSQVSSVPESIARQCGVHLRWIVPL